MYFDAATRVSNEQEVTTSAPSTDHLDLGVAASVGYSKQMMIIVNEAVAAAGAATVTFKIQCDSNPNFSSSKTAIASGEISKANLGVNTQIHLPLPAELDKRYLRVYYEVGSGPLTAGKFTAMIVEGVQKWEAKYSSNS